MARTRHQDAWLRPLAPRAGSVRPRVLWESCSCKSTVIRASERDLLPVLGKATTGFCGGCTSCGHAGVRFRRPTRAFAAPLWADCARPRSEAASARRRQASPGLGGPSLALGEKICMVASSMRPWTKPAPRSMDGRTAHCPACRGRWRPSRQAASNGQRPTEVGLSPPGVARVHHHIPAEPSTTVERRARR